MSRAEVAHYSHRIVGRRRLAMTLSELREYLPRAFLTWNAASQDEDKCQLLNRPVCNGAKLEKLPPLLFLLSERANGNDLGVAIEAK